MHSRNQSFDLTEVALPTQSIRILAYVVCAATFIAGIHHGNYNQSYYWIIPFAVFYPVFSHWSTSFLYQRHFEYVSNGLILIDSFLWGMAIVLTKFNLVPCIMILLIANTKIIYTIGIHGWLYNIVTIGIGAFVGINLFGFELIVETPLFVSVVSATGILLYLTVLSHFSFRQSQALAIARQEISQQKEQTATLSKKLAKYLPPQVWGSVFSGRKDIKLETKRKKLSVFFSDIQGFAEISEDLQPEALTDLLNNYFTEMSSIALRYGGTIDKFIGDAMLIFFGDPSTHGSREDALACASMAIEMRKHMKVLRKQWRKRGITKPMHVRMGIHSGYCTVGNFGAESRMDYTIIGKEVNLASRLESAADTGQICISNDTYELVKDLIMCRHIGPLNVKGFTKPVIVHEIVDFRKDLGASNSYIEHEKEGFSMYLDIDKLRTQSDQAKWVARALADALNKLKSKIKTN